jgi:hypothetical protein
MNEPAFPGLHPSKECQYQDKGMSLRDYFAAKAMQVLMAEVDGDNDDNPGAPRWLPDDVAQLAYEQADAMLKAREQR